MDATSLGLAIGDCKERPVCRLTYAPESFGKLHSFLIMQMKSENSAIDKDGGNTSDHNPTGEAEHHKQNDPPSGGIDWIKKAGILFVEIIFASSVATGFWLLGERLITHGSVIVGGLFNYIADCLYFATVPLTVLKIWSRTKLVWGAYSLCLVVLGIVFIASPEAAKPKSETPAIITVQQPEFIEGTQFTRKQLDDFFPFGYAVIYLNEEGKKEIHEVHNKLFDWKMNWDGVKIDPDFRNGVVNFTIPAPSGSGTRGQIIMDNSVMVTQMPLTNGICRRIGINLGANPVPNACVLSDNQRIPVFAIGYRIPKAGEGRAPNQPWFFIQP